MPFQATEACQQRARSLLRSGCHAAFYRTRCRICEGPIKQPKRGERLICRKAACIKAFRERSCLGRYHGSQAAELISKTPGFTGPKVPVRDDRGPNWATGTKKPLQMTFGGYAVVPDPDWPNMYRVRRPDGSLTEMVNLTRARDAARFCTVN